VETKNPRITRPPGWLSALAVMLLLGLILVAVEGRGPTASETGVASPKLLRSQSGSPLSIHVSSNQLVDAAGTPVRLLGANRSGTEYACQEGTGFYDGPVDDAAIEAMRSWGMTAVRVSLNEGCWLGLADIKAEYAGESYQQKITELVDRINAHGMYVILDLHWNPRGSSPPTDQQAMPDRLHAPSFWAGVASRFKSNPGVVFDLYNEPYPDGNRNSTAAWTCVRDGGDCRGVGFAAAGMQELVDAVRSAGATNVVLVAGPQYAGVVDRWLEFKPNDPVNQLAASMHIYGPDYSPCSMRTCWDAQIAPLAMKVPVVIGEVGSYRVCDHVFLDEVMNWADGHSISYLAWSWIVGDCARHPSLIRDYAGTPSPYGVGLRDHLRYLA
jgi:endoglucanase